MTKFVQLWHFRSSLPKTWSNFLLEARVEGYAKPSSCYLQEAYSSTPGQDCGELNSNLMFHEQILRVNLSEVKSKKPFAISNFRILTGQEPGRLLTYPCSRRLLSRATMQFKIDQSPQSSDSKHLTSPRLSKTVGLSRPHDSTSTVSPVIFLT